MTITLENLPSEFAQFRQEFREFKEFLKRSENSSKKTQTKRSVKELAEHVGVSELTIRNYIKDGKIKAHRIGRRIFIDEGQFEAGLVEVKSLKYKR